MKALRRNAHLFIPTVLIVLLFAAGVFRWTEMHGNLRTLECTVTDVDTRANPDKDGNAIRYLVRTEQCDTLQIKGGLGHGTFFPGLKAKNLDEGTTYRFEVVGERNVPLMTYPKVKNIFPVD